VFIAAQARNRIACIWIPPTASARFLPRIRLRRCAIGSMGRLASGALDNGGKVVGVIPKFMQELEWGYGGLTELHIVEDMRERKHRMLLGSDAVIALPGGSGTLEELLEAITLKRLGIYLN